MQQADVDEFEEIHNIEIAGPVPEMLHDLVTVDNKEKGKEEDAGYSTNCNGPL